MSIVRCEQIRVKKNHDQWQLYSKNDLAEGKVESIFPKKRYILISLKVPEGEVGSFKTREEEWLNLLSHVSKMKPVKTDDPIFKSALGRILTAKAANHLLEQQKDTIMSLDEYEVHLASAIIEGREKGMAEGRAEGLAEGERERLALANRIAQLEAENARLRAGRVSDNQSNYKP